MLGKSHLCFNQELQTHTLFPSASEQQSHKEPGKGELATISHKFFFVLHPDKGKYHWLKNQSWLIKGLAGLPKIFAANVERRCSYRQNLVLLAITELTPKKKTSSGRKSLSSSVRGYCGLWVKFGSKGDHIETENLIVLATGSFDVSLNLAKLYVWKCWIANRILRAQ